MHEEAELVRTRANIAVLGPNLHAAGLPLPSAAPAYLGALYAGASPAEAFEAARRQCLLELPPTTRADYAPPHMQRRLSDWEIDRAIAARAEVIARIRAVPNPFVEAPVAAMERAA